MHSLVGNRNTDIASLDTLTWIWTRGTSQQCVWVLVMIKL